MSLVRFRIRSTNQWFRFVSAVTLCLVSLIAIVKYDMFNYDYDQLRGSSIDKHLSFGPRNWVVPNMAPATDTTYWKPPDKQWAVFVPKQFQNVIKCQACIHEQNTNILSPMVGVQSSNPKLVDTEVTRKMATFHFLIKNGARAIMHSSDTSSIEKSISRFSHDSEPYGVSGLEYIGVDITRDSFHYHYRSDADYNKPCQYRIRRRMKPVWTVGVRCRSTEDKGIPEGTSLTDHQSPPIFSSTPKFDIETFSDSLFQYDGLWAMFASIFSKTSQTRVWAIWAQRMLAEIEGEMAITSLPCPPDRKTTLVQSEPDAATKSVFESVAKWQCEKSQSFFTCAIQLANHMLKTNHVTQNEVTLLDTWIKSLKNANYSEPQRVSKTTKKEDVVPFCVFHNPALITPFEKRKPYKFFTRIEPACPKVGRPSNATNLFEEHTVTEPPKTRDIALVSFCHYKSFYRNNGPILYDMYHHYFSTFVICGPSYKHFKQFQTNFKKPVAFIEARDNRGFLAQECMTFAMMVNYDVKGYLQASDDALINAWSIGNLPRDQFWFQKEILVTERTTDYIPDFFLKTVAWKFWHGYEEKFGKVRMEKVWEIFDTINSTKNNNVIEKEIVNSFRQTLKNNFGNWQKFCYQASDIFYVPAWARRQWIVLGEIFGSNDVYLEIAIPTMICGMDSIDRVFRLAGWFLWYEQRPQYRKFYKVNHHFMHAWKISWINNPKEATFLCNVVLPEIVKERTSTK